LTEPSRLEREASNLVIENALKMESMLFAVVDFLSLERTDVELSAPVLAAEFRGVTSPPVWRNLLVGHLPLEQFVGVKKSARRSHERQFVR
jgi:hypothetical protein